MTDPLRQLIAGPFHSFPPHSQTCSRCALGGEAVNGTACKVDDLGAPSIAALSEEKK